MAGTKIKVKVKWGQKTKVSTIKITARTLGGALKQLNKRREWGEFKGRIPYRYGPKGGLITWVTLRPYYIIRMPKWTRYPSAPKVCQREWDRMWKRLEEHENAHRLIFLEALAKIHEKLSRATDWSSSKVTTKIAEGEKTGQDNEDEYDFVTDHGRKRGVYLKITDECD